MVIFPLFVLLITVINTLENQEVEQCTKLNIVPTYDDIGTFTSIEKNEMRIEIDYPIFEEKLRDESSKKKKKREYRIIEYDVSVVSNNNITSSEPCRSKSFFPIPLFDDIKESFYGEERFTVRYEDYSDEEGARKNVRREDDEGEETEEEDENLRIKFPLLFTYELHQHYQLFPLNTRQDLALYRVLDTTIEHFSGRNYRLYTWVFEVEHYGELTIGFSGFKSGKLFNYTSLGRKFDSYDNHISTLEISTYYTSEEEVEEEILIFEYNKEEASRIVQEVYLRPVSTGFVSIIPFPDDEDKNGVDYGDENSKYHLDEEDQQQDGGRKNQVVEAIQYISISGENETFPSTALSSQKSIVLTTVLSPIQVSQFEEVVPISTTFTCLTCPKERTYHYTTECSDENQKECFHTSSLDTQTPKPKTSSLTVFEIQARRLDVGTYTVHTRFALTLLGGPSSQQSGQQPKRVVFDSFSQIVISRYEAAPSVFKMVITFAGAALGFMSAGGGLAIGLFVMRVIRKHSDKNRVYYQQVGGKHIIDESTGERIQLLDMGFHLRHKEIQFNQSEIRTLSRSFEEVFKLQKASKYTPYVHCKHCWEEQHGKSLPQIQHKQKLLKLQQQQKQIQQQRAMVMQKQRNNNNHPILFRRPVEEDEDVLDDDEVLAPPSQPVSILRRTTQQSSRNNNITTQEDESNELMYLKYDGRSSCCVKCGIPLLRFISFTEEELFCVLCAMMNKYQPRPHGRCLLHLSNAKKSNYHRRKRKSNSNSPSPNNNNKNNTSSKTIQPPPPPPPSKNGYHHLPISVNNTTTGTNSKNPTNLDDYQKQGAVYVIFRGQFSVGSVSRQMKKRKLLLQKQKEEQQQIKSPSINNLQRKTNTTTVIKKKKKKKKGRKGGKNTFDDSKVAEWIEKITSPSIWKLNSLMRFEYLSLMSHLVHADLSGVNNNFNSQQHHSLLNGLLSKKKHTEEIKRMEHSISLLQMTLRLTIEKISEVGPNMKSRFMKRLKIQNLKLGNEETLENQFCPLRNIDLETFFDNFRQTLSLFAAQISRHVSYLKKNCNSLKMTRKKQMEQYKRFNNKNNEKLYHNLKRSDTRKRKKKRKRYQNEEEEEMEEEEGNHVKQQQLQKFRFVDEIDDLVDDQDLYFSENTTPSPNMIIQQNNNNNKGLLIEHGGGDDEHFVQNNIMIKSLQKKKKKKRRKRRVVVKSKKRKRNDGEVIRFGEHHYFEPNIQKRKNAPPLPPLPEKIAKQLKQEEEEEEDMIVVQNNEEYYHLFHHPNNNNTGVEDISFLSQIQQQQPLFHQQPIKQQILEEEEEDVIVVEHSLPLPPPPPPQQQQQQQFEGDHQYRRDPHIQQKQEDDELFDFDGFVKNLDVDLLSLSGSEGHNLNLFGTSPDEFNNNMLLNQQQPQGLFFNPNNVDQDDDSMLGLLEVDEQDFGIQDQLL